MAEESPRTKLRKEIETAKEIQALETELAQIKQATSALQQSAPSATPADGARKRRWGIRRSTQRCGTQ